MSTRHLCPVPRPLALFLGPVAVLALAYGSLWHALGAEPIYQFDESLYANNALDLYFDGGTNPLVVRRHGDVDAYNVKPPLVIWLQAASFRAFGLSEFAVRLPSALAGTLTALAVYVFAARTLRSPATGLIAAGVLLSSAGYIDDNVARAGDLDAVLTAFTTAYVLVFLRVTLRPPGRTWPWALALGTLILGGYLSKSVAAFFFLPGILLVAALPANRWIWRKPSFYLVAAATLSACIGFALLRESLAPGYLDAVYQSEIRRVGAAVMTWQVQPWDFYYDQLRDWQFRPYLYPALFAPALWLLTGVAGRSPANAPDPRKRRALGLLIVLTASYLLLVSIPPVKLEWYTAPLFPPLALLVALSLKLVVELLPWRQTLKPGLPEALPLLLALPLVGPPYAATVKRVAHVRTPLHPHDVEGYALREALRQLPEVRKVQIFKRSSELVHFDQLRFYTRSALADGRLDAADYVTEPHFAVGDIVLVYAYEDRMALAELYATEALFVLEGVYLLRIR